LKKSNFRFDIQEYHLITPTIPPKYNYILSWKVLRRFLITKKMIIKGDCLLFEEDLILEISDKNFNKEGFVEKVLNDSKIRDEIVQLMLNHPKIMVYHHSYSIISQASQMRPELFYQYWDDFSLLLDHPNSYHRDF
jgi:hypothetical protein